MSSASVVIVFLPYSVFAPFKEVRVIFPLLDSKEAKLSDSLRVKVTLLLGVFIITLLLCSSIKSDCVPDSIFI